MKTYYIIIPKQYIFIFIFYSSRDARKQQSAGKEQTCYYSEVHGLWSEISQADTSLPNLK